MLCVCVVSSQEGSRVPHRSSWTVTNSLYAAERDGLERAGLGQIGHRAVLESVQSVFIFGILSCWFSFSLPHSPPPPCVWGGDWEFKPGPYVCKHSTTELQLSLLELTLMNRKNWVFLVLDTSWIWPKCCQTLDNIYLCIYTSKVHLYFVYVFRNVGRKFWGMSKIGLLYQIFIDW